MKERKQHLRVFFFILYFAMQATHPGLSVVIKNGTSCEDLKVKENYIYNSESKWTKDEVDHEEWRNIPQHTVLAYIDHHNNTWAYKTEHVINVSTGFLEITQCLNVTFHAFRKKGKDTVVNFIVSGSQPEINGSKLVSSEHDVTSQTSWIILGIITGTIVLLIVIGLVVWRMGAFTQCRRNHQEGQEQEVKIEMDQDQSLDQEDEAESM